MKKLIFITILLLFSKLLLAQVTYLMHYLPTLSQQQASSYRGYDVIIVDHEVIHNSPDGLRQMKRDNPDLKILVYANKIEWHDPMFRDKPWSLNMIKVLERYPDWYMRGTDGQKLEFWPNTTLMNCRADGPRHVLNGKSYTYIEFFTEQYIEDVIGEYKRQGIQLDGMLDDELLKSISFIGHYGNNVNGVDSNGDGIDDDPAELDRQWRLGNAYFLQAVREEMGEDFLILGNGGHGYYMQWCNGKQFEFFPEVYLNENDKLMEAWPENMRNASGMEIALFNARANAYGKKENWMFTICSSVLLDNTMFSYGQNTPYDKKYDLNLGEALDKWYEENGIYTRRFQNGTVYVDPVNKTGEVKR